MKRLLPALALLAAVASARAEPTVTVLPLGFEADHLRGPATRVAQTIASTEAFRELRGTLKPPLAVVWGRDGAAALTLESGSVRVARGRRAADPATLERGRDGLPDSRISGAGALFAQFEGGIREPALGSLGSPVQARGLAITERRPSPPTSDVKPVAQDLARVPSGDGAVFEDREPHAIDLGSDGPAFAAVRSHPDRGAALALVGKRDGTWRVIAETPPDGEPSRWLNPITAGERAASNDLALIRRPDRDGLLQVWRLEGGRLVLRAEKAGYSNHVAGSPAQDLAVWFLAEDGSARLAVPALDRKALALLSVGADIREIARVPLPARVMSGVTALGRGRDVHLLAGLEDGRVVDVRP